MKYKNKLAFIVAAGSILVFATAVEAQSISIGPGGLRVRGARGERVNIGRPGIQIRQSQTRPYVQPQRHGVVIHEAGVRHHQMPVPQHHSHGQVIVNENGSQGVTTPQPIRSGNFIVTNKAAATFQTAAESAFGSGDLNYAAQSVSMAIKKDSNNGLLHLFASHVYFAIGDYRAAAHEIDVATRIVPFNQWGVVVRNVHRFDSRQHYEAQLYQLNRYLDQNPGSVDARVVLGFYSSLRGERRVAGDQFAIVLNSQPQHALAKRLSTKLTTREVSVQTVPRRQEQKNGSVLIRNSATEYGNEVRIQPGSDNHGVIQVNPGQPNSVIIDDRGSSVHIGDGTLIDLVP